MNTREMDRNVYLAMRNNLLSALVKQGQKRIAKAQGLMALQDYKNRVFKHTPAGSSGMALPNSLCLKGRTSTMSKRVAAKVVGIDEIMKEWDEITSTNLSS